MTQEELVDDVVRALRQLGGRGAKSQVLALIYSWHETEFSHPYYREIVNGTVPRWRKHIEWAKQRAVVLGLVLRPNESGWGVWALTPRDRGTETVEVAMPRVNQKAPDTAHGEEIRGEAAS